MARELWRPIDIANNYGVTRQRVNAWLDADTFPAPDVEIPGTRLYLPAKVRRWVAEHRPAVALDAEAAR